ncbi:hypothetical protein ACFSNA_02400 [Pedobacter mendelii]|uniref:hypothetical protein n=1 Tax=Pedobacter TaxID=84567 RepID=UPI001ABFE73B|nr:hypothetical protein [Pedobacter jejuensis]
MPAGLEESFEEVGNPLAAEEFLPPPPMTTETIKDLQAIAQKHEQVLYPPTLLDSIF